MTPEKKKELVEVAKKIALRKITSYRTPGSKKKPVTFEWRPGYCARFIRQLHEAVLDLDSHTWKYRADSARGMAKLLYADGKKAAVGEKVELSDLQPGDLLFWNTGKHGHVAIYVGNETTVENTSYHYDPAQGAIRSRRLTPERLKSIRLVARI